MNIYERGDFSIKIKGRHIGIRGGHRDIEKKILLFFAPIRKAVLSKYATRALYDKNETCPLPSEVGPFIGVIYEVKNELFYQKKVNSIFF